MMTSETLRTLALSLPEAHEAPHFERASFRVGKKVFATVSADGQEAMVRVRQRERLLALLEGQPAVFFSFGAWTESLGALGVRLAAADPLLVRELLTDSWAAVAPKRAHAALAEAIRGQGAP